MPRDVRGRVFTVDVEEWYHANYGGRPPQPSNLDDSVVHQCHRLLDLLSDTNTIGTFFVLAETAKRYPGLVREFAGAGHEVASHNFTHDLIYDMTEQQFGEQARRSKELLEDIIGRLVVGFRAPSWSVGSRTPWFWDELREAGYLYSSSVFPFRNFMYGDGSAPRFAHYRDGIWEIPASTARIFGRRVPFSGGFYLRSMPMPAITVLGRRVAREDQSVNYYIHPREVDPSAPRLELSSLNSLIHYYGIGRVLGKLRRILNASVFQTMGELYLALEEGLPPD